MKTSTITISLLFLMLSMSLKATDYLAQMDETLYAEYAIMRMDMLKNDKLMRNYEMEFYRSGDKMRMEFTAPATEKGRRMLNDNTSLWMYLPRTSKVMKLPFKQSFMGSDASNADLMRMAFKKDYEITQSLEKGDGAVELTLKAKNPEVAYDKMVVVFDLKMKMPVKQEMYSLSDKLIKTIFYEEATQIEGTYFPTVLIIKEELQKNTLTKIYYSGMKKRNNKSPEYFTLGALKK